MSTAVQYKLTNVEFKRPNGIFNIPNLRHRGLIPARIVFDKDTLKTFRDGELKEFKISLGGSVNIISKLDTAYFSHNLTIDLLPFESQIINSSSKQQIIISSKQPTSDKLGKNILLSFVIEYKETCGEIKKSCSVAKLDELYDELKDLTFVPYKIAFKPKIPLPTGFDIKLRFEIIDVHSAGYDLCDADTIQTVANNGAIINWDFGFIPDLVFREHYLQLIDIMPTKLQNAFPMDIIMYTAPE
jgi:hypothetical protein